jgi:hypothetical protein
VSSVAGRLVTLHPSSDDRTADLCPIGGVGMMCVSDGDGRVATRRGRAIVGSVSVGELDNSHMKMLCFCNIGVFKDLLPCRQPSPQYLS